MSTEQPITKPRAELLALAQKCGAVLTGKPDGSESITVVFTITAWRTFDAALGFWTCDQNETEKEANNGKQQTTGA